MLETLKSTLNSFRNEVGAVYRRYIPNLAVLFLFPVSCWSTFSGIRELMRSTGAFSEFEGLFVSTGLTAGIQIMLLFAVVSIIRAPLRRRPLYLSIYVVTVFFSVVFGYAFYFRHLRADDYAQEVHQSESQRMLLEGESYRARFNATALRLNELSAYSQSQSELEDRTGGTCGDRSPSGRGPRARRRRTDALSFAGYNRQVETLRTDLEAQISFLREDVGGYSPVNLQSHHHVLDVFYQRLQGNRMQAQELLLEIKAYIHSRFPEGRYTIVEGGITYPCPDSRMEVLSSLVLGQKPPDLPGPPQKFAAQNPKAVVNYAMDRMTNWTAGTANWLAGWFRASGSNAVAGPPAKNALTQNARDNLPLFLGLLVDCLIFLAAFSKSYSIDSESSSLEQMGSLEDLSPQMREKLRRQLAMLLGCSPGSSTFAAYRLLSRYELRSRPGLGKHFKVARAASTILVPRTGAFLEQRPEITRLRDLVRLLETLQLATCKTTDLSWEDLKGPLPPGLSEISHGASDTQGEYVEVFRLDERLIGDLVKEAIVSEELLETDPATLQNNTVEGEAPASA